MIEFDGFGDVLYVTTQLAIQYIVTSFVTIHLLKLDTHSLSVTSFMGPSQFATFSCLWAPFCSQRSVAYGRSSVHNVQLLMGPIFFTTFRCSVAYGLYFVHYDQLHMGSILFTTPIVSYSVVMWTFNL